MRARLPPGLRGARGKGGDSLSLGPAPRQPFPGAPASAPLAAPAWPPPLVRSGAPAPLAPCPGPRLDGTRALRPSLTLGPLETRSCSPQALPSWSPCSQKVKSCDTPPPSNPEAGKSQTVPAQEAVQGSRGRGRSDRGGAIKRKGLGKEVVPWASWALSCSSPQGHRKQDCLLPARRPRAEAQGSKWSLLSSLPTAPNPGSTPVSGVMRPNLATKYYRRWVRSEGCHWPQPEAEHHTCRGPQTSRLRKWQQPLQRMLKGVMVCKYFEGKLVNVVKGVRV